MVELMANSPTSIIRMDRDVRSVIPISVRIVIATLVFTCDFDNPVLWLLEIEVDTDAARLTCQPFAVEAKKEAFRKTERFEWE